MMLPFRLIEDLSIESKAEVEKIIEDMKKAVANDDSSDATGIEIETDSPTHSR